MQCNTGLDIQQASTRLLEEVVQLQLLNFSVLMLYLLKAYYRADRHPDGLILLTQKTLLGLLAFEEALGKVLLCLVGRSGRELDLWPG